MQINKPLYNVNSIYPYIRSYNTKYWQQLQTVMDASKTRSQNLELRKNGFRIKIRIIIKTNMTV